VGEADADAVVRRSVLAKDFEAETVFYDYSPGRGMWPAISETSRPAWWIRSARAGGGGGVVPGVSLGVVRRWS